MKRCAIVLAVAAVAVTLVRPAAAHERSASYSTWELGESGGHVRMRIDERELTRLPQAALPSPQREQRIAETLAAALTARRDGLDCHARDASLRSTETPGRALVSWKLECPRAGAIEVESRLSQTLGAPHHHFARILDGDRIEETLLHEERPLWRQAEAPPSAAEALGVAFALGLDHILSGYDHLAFVLGLLLAAAALSEVAAVITGFTAAHSLTLALATLGLVRPSGSGVEIMIAFSIAVLAIENLMTATRTGALPSSMAAVLALLLPPTVAAVAGGSAIPVISIVGIVLFSCCYLTLVARSAATRRMRWIVAFVFGLLHGFGFAGALVDASYTPATLATTLLGFNLGVEAGQLAIVALAWPLMARARGRLGARYGRLVVEPVSTALLAAATCWYVTRVFG